MSISNSISGNSAQVTPPTIPKPQVLDPRDIGINPDSNNKSSSVRGNTSNNSDIFTLNSQSLALDPTDIKRNPEIIRSFVSEPGLVRQKSNTSQTAKQEVLDPRDIGINPPLYRLNPRGSSMEFINNTPTNNFNPQIRSQELQRHNERILKIEEIQRLSVGKWNLH